MKKYLFIFILFVFSGFLFSQAYIGNNIIKGYILSADNNPVEKALVNFYNIKLKEGFNVNTDKRGKFKSPAIIKGLWRIRIYKDGFLPKELFIYTKEKKTILDKIILKKPHEKADESTAEQLDKAVKFFIKNKYKKAIKIYEKLIKENQKPEYISILLGESYYYNGEYDKAIPCFSEALKNNDRIDLTIKIIDCFMEKGEGEKSLKYIKKLDINKIENPFILSDIGIFFYKRGEFEKANLFLERGIKIYPENSEAYYYLGLSYTSINKPEKAVQYLKRFIELEPDSPDVVVADSIINSFKDFNENR